MSYRNPILVVVRNQSCVKKNKLLMSFLYIDIDHGLGGPI